MVYEPPVYPTTIPTQTGAEPDLPDWNDDTTWWEAKLPNALKKELLAVLTELGALPKGTYDDVAARLLAQASALFDTEGNKVIEVTTDAAHVNQPVALVGSGRVVNHIVLPARGFKLPGVKPATEGVEGLFITLDFVHTAEREARAGTHIPFRWDPSTEVEIMIDWFCDDDASGGDVVWGIEWHAIKNGEAVAGTTGSITQAFTGRTAGLMQRSLMTSKIPAADLERMDDMGVRIFRLPADEGDTLDKTIRFVKLHLHFTANQLGDPV